MSDYSGWAVVIDAAASTLLIPESGEVVNAPSEAGVGELEAWQIVELLVVDGEYDVTPTDRRASPSSGIKLGRGSNTAEVTFDDGTTTNAEIEVSPDDALEELLSPLRQLPDSFVRLPDEVGEGFWWPDGGPLDQWLDGRRQRLVDKSAAEARNEVRRKRPDHFVNPYTFVPLPASTEPGQICPRGEPQGHAAWLPGNLSGHIDIRWEALSPVMVRTSREEGDPGDEPVGTMASRAGRYLVPGSSVKGAVRSLHETIAGGCLRVVDPGYTPVHRDHASTGHRKGWELGLVAEVDDDGKPTRVQKCTDIVWTLAASLRAARDRASVDPALRSGQRFRIAQAALNAATGEFGRRELPAGAALDSDDSAGDWVILVAATNAARDTKPFHCATGRLVAEYRTVPDSAWDQYLDLVDGATDCSPGDRESLPVEHDKEGFIGWSLGPGRRLAPGQVIWVKPDGPDKIASIALSNLWRSHGHHPVGQRLPADDALLPCTNPENLCPSCQIFGSADVTGSGDGAPQHSYRSHIRFGDALAAPGTALEGPVDLAPLGQPRPSSGQFYLLNRQRRSAATNQDRPTAQWGSALDSSSNPRLIRGRKFYWHGSPEVQRDRWGKARHERRGDQSDTVTSRAKFAPTGTQFSLRLTFENLTPAQLGGLLATVDPDRLFRGRLRAPGFVEDGPPLAVRIGGGKPFGFGSVRPIEVELAIETAESRYLGSRVQAPAPDELINHFVAAIPEPIKDLWPDVSAVLNPGHILETHVWYPPGDTWDVLEQGRYDRFDRAFVFFGRTNGQYLKEGDRELETLPDPRLIDQMLPNAEA